MFLQENINIYYKNKTVSAPLISVLILVPFFAKKSIFPKVVSSTGLSCFVRFIRVSGLSFPQILCLKESSFALCSLTLEPDKAPLISVLILVPFFAKNPYSLKWWAVPDSNRWPPQCQCDTLPSAPTAHKFFYCQFYYRETRISLGYATPLTKQYSIVLFGRVSTRPFTSSVVNVYQETSLYLFYKKLSSM